MSRIISQEELGIISRSPRIAELVDTVRSIAVSDLTVLLVGESGVGKEVFARATHQLSQRSSGRFLAINCGAIPETLLESELFGHERGAFTGATETRKGLFESAEKGTVLLDEIGEMPLNTQVKLLRVLETLEYTRVGSSEPRRADVRIIAATNRDLDREVRRGTFRQDLYYRLALAQVHIPPLREHAEDIPLLFAHYAFSVAERLGIPFGGITREAMELLQEYTWPGNIRELRNFVELVVTIERGEKITEDIVFRHLGPRRTTMSMENPSAIVHLPGKTPEQVERELIYQALINLTNEVGSMKRMIVDGGARKPETQSIPALPPPPPSLDELLRDLEDLRLDRMEHRLINVALQRFNNNRREAADALGISERTLYRKLSEMAVMERTTDRGNNLDGEGM